MTRSPGRPRSVAQLRQHLEFHILGMATSVGEEHVCHGSSGRSKPPTAGIRVLEVALTKSLPAGGANASYLAAEYL